MWPRFLVDVLMGAPIELASRWIRIEFKMVIFEFWMILEFLLFLDFLQISKDIKWHKSSQVQNDIKI